MLHEIAKTAGIDSQIYLREELNNLDTAPDVHDWLIRQFTRTTPSQGK